jgi:hypothetical protein
MYFMCVVALLLCIVLVVNLRRSRFGRVVIAVRDNDTNAESAGIPVVRTKLAAFALSGMLAGFSGAVFAFQQRGISAASFNPTASINAFVQVVVGGVSSVWGALLGSAFMNGLNTSLTDYPEIAATLAPVAALYLLYAYPGGLISLLAKTRDAILRIVAQRNQLIVPSLFADMDPEALHLRLIPISAPISGSGMQSIRNRYRMATSMLAATRRDKGAPSPEAEAMAVVAEKQVSA